MLLLACSQNWKEKQLQICKYPQILQFTAAQDGLFCKLPGKRQTRRRRRRRRPTRIFPTRWFKHRPPLPSTQGELRDYARVSVTYCSSSPPECRRRHHHQWEAATSSPRARKRRREGSKISIATRWGAGVPNPSGIELVLRVSEVQNIQSCSHLNEGIAQNCSWK